MSVLHVDIPVIETARLTLRAPVLGDLAPLTAFFASAHSHFVGGPMGADATQRAMFATIGGWALHGSAPWHIAERSTNRFVGWTGLLHSADRAEPGFAWTILPAFQGNGFATDAAGAALAHVRGVLGLTAPATFIDADNAASLHVAAKLGFAHVATTGTELTLRHAGGET